MFQRAIDLDPNYATAYAELGLSLIEAVGSGWTDFIADDLARAETLARKALSLDSESTTAYRLLAEAHLARRHFDLVLGQIDRALEINPMPRVFRSAVPFWCGRAEPRRPCPGSKALFALTAPMPERPFSSARPITSLIGTASPSKPSTVP
jgi:tetratricopeptide (TPR) repeat protein